MSVILFAKEQVYQELADAYEGLKPFMRLHGMHFNAEKDEQFYKALRRMYFANVATYLCQYHDQSPLSDEELVGIDPFTQLEGKPDARRAPFASVAYAEQFVSAWSQLCYNCITNDGETYLAKQSVEYFTDLALAYSQIVLESLGQELRRGQP